MKLYGLMCVAVLSMAGGMESPGETMVAVCESKLTRAAALLVAVPDWVRSYRSGTQWLNERVAERDALAAEFQKIKEGSSGDVTLYNRMYTEFQRKFAGDFGTGQGEVISNMIGSLVSNLELQSSALERASSGQRSSRPWSVEFEVLSARASRSKAIEFLRKYDPVKKGNEAILRDCFRVPSVHGEGEQFFSTEALVRALLWSPQGAYLGPIELEVLIAEIKSSHEALNKACENDESRRTQENDERCVIQ